jgi:hypothetical protein
MRPEFTLHASAAEALDLLYQHRLLSTSQLHELLTPYARRSVVRLLDGLADRELATAVRLRTRPGGWGQRLWFLTQLGAR